MSDLSFKSSRAKVQADMGKWAEEQARKWLEARSQREYGFSFHRYPDARAARSALAAQPADFLVALRSGENKNAWHLEVKETAEFKRLPKAKIGQYGMLKKYCEAGVVPIVLVYRSLFKDWYVMWPADLFGYDECPPSFPFDNRPTYPTAAAALETMFHV